MGVGVSEGVSGVYVQEWGFGATREGVGDRLNACVECGPRVWRVHDRAAMRALVCWSRPELACESGF